VDASSLGLPYRSGESHSPVGETINGKLLTNQTTVTSTKLLRLHWSGRQNIPRIAGRLSKLGPRKRITVFPFVVSGAVKAGQR
jgi:hypothetical protein